MQYGIAPFYKFAYSAPIGEIATDPRDAVARFAARTRQCADRVAGTDEVF